MSNLDGFGFAINWRSKSAHTDHSYSQGNKSTHLPVVAFALASIFL